MIRILETLLTNAVTVALLAAVVWAISRKLQRPAITHVLWVLLLVKLLTPSFIHLPLPFQTTVPQVVSQVLRDATPDSTALLATNVSGEPSTTGDARPASAEVAAANPTPAPSAEVPVERSTLSQNIVRGLLVVWLAGTLFYLARLVFLQLRFMLFLRANEEIDVDLIGEGYDLAWQMGLDNPPKVRILRGALSPMLCGIGRALTLILPAELSDRLSPESRATLIVHELAHFQRRDHFVRILEGIATSVFWWHPVVWFIRRQIEVVEEECVDARVVAQFPDRPRQYAEALLDTLDFLCERRVILPPMASGLGSAPLLRQRLKQIMSDDPAERKVVSRRGAVSLSVVAACVLPLQIIQFHRAATEGTLGTIQPFSSISVSSKDDIPTPLVGARILAPGGEFLLIRSAADSGIVVNFKTGARSRLSLENVTAAAFSTNGKLLLGCSNGTLKLYDCNQNEFDSIIRLGESVTSIDWLTANRFAVVIDGRSVVVVNEQLQQLEYRRFAERITSVRGSRGDDRLVITTLDSDELISSDYENAVGSIQLLNSALATIDLYEIIRPAAFARFDRESRDIHAYEQSGRVTTFSPGPLTPVETKWLPPNAVSELEFSSQADDSRYIPEAF